MLARSTLFFLLACLAALLVWSVWPEGRTPSPILDLRGESGLVLADGRGADFLTPNEEADSGESRELIRSQLPEDAGVAKAELQGPAAAGVFDGEAEEAPLIEALLPWQLDVRNAVTDQRISVAVTIRDAAAELVPVTVFVPTTLSGEWRSRKLLLEAEGFRTVVIEHEGPKHEKLCSLCPIRQLQLEILPPEESEGSFDVTLRSNRAPKRQFEVGAGPPRTERMNLGTQDFLSLEVSPSGLLSSTHRLVEETIQLNPVGNTLHVVDLTDYESPKQGELLLSLRFRERVWGTSTWWTSIEALGEDESGNPLQPLEPIAFKRWETDEEGLSYQLNLGKAAQGHYRLRLDALRLMREFHVGGRGVTEVAIDAPALATIELGVRWAGEFMPKGYVSTGVSYRVHSGRFDESPLNSRADLFSRSENLYRVSGLPGTRFIFEVGRNSLGTGDPVEHVATAGKQLVELDLHPLKPKSR